MGQTMRLISHRGNTDGANSDTENRIETVDKVIYDEGFYCEVDIRCKQSSLFLGHDLEQEQISIEWLLDRSGRLFIHCKDLESLDILSNHKWGHILNYFYHNEDDATLTSHGQIWLHPKANYVPKKSIIVLPMKALTLEGCPHDDIYGICTDSPRWWRENFNII